MAKAITRSASDVKEVLGSKITYVELGKVLNIPNVTGTTEITGDDATIINAVLEHRRQQEAANPATTPTEVDESAEETPSESTVEAYLEGANAEKRGMPIMEVCQQLSEQLGFEILPATVLNVLGVFGNENTYITTSTDEIMQRLREQATKFEEGTFGAVLTFFRQQGHIGLMPSTVRKMLAGRVPDIESWDGAKVLSTEEQTELSKWLNATLVICKQMAADAALPTGTQADHYIMNPKDPVEEQWFEFTARCGHKARQRVTEVMQNLGNANDQVAAWDQLCYDCGKVRALMLTKPQDAAKEGNLTCQRCNGDLFQTGMDGLMLSRAHIWQNGMRNVMSIMVLPDRLLPEHRRTNRVCMRNRMEELRRQKASRRELVMACDNDIVGLMATVATIVDKSPETKASLTANLQSEVATIRRGYGFPESDQAYTALRVEVGLVRGKKAPAKKVPAKKAAAKKSASSRTRAKKTAAAPARRAS